ncbi:MULTISPECIES: Fe-S cluster assembly protein SufD [unclassified Rhizobium]|uniref:Fe-S cluster assembly protein SufD n=1 Tax=unclassified Rhizobium TaxID=2613769 RepID=UPI0007142CF8|nr:MULTISPECIES: Fe-S cluster assembly protein SufD [unclassified Rhizobium]KQS98241.1 ABC transporter ATP-binding protein [Rhizobium sp. Leaf386]KQT00505.1 ABC transporter ATP-binding protein [Rhizobium sp. Leaf391]KQT97507.1 ABC transporter ATP-binding protein [Rhizobium sp. Leaf453]
MNMQTAITMTAAETALVDAYTAAIGDLPGEGAVLPARDALLADLRTQGLPTRRLESWHYTDLRALLRSVPALEPTAFAERVDPLVPGSAVLAVLNGKADAKGLPATVNVRTYAESLIDGVAAADLIARDAEDAIGRINGSLVRDGFEIEVPEGTVLEQPLELQLVQSAGQNHSRFPVTFGASTKATVIERHLSVSDAASLVTVVSDLILDDNADITWIILQQQGASDSHLAQVNFDLGTNAKLRLFVINAGGKLVRQEIHGVTTGEGADFKLRGINLLGGETHTDITFTLGHDVPNTTSTEVIRNVLFDRAKGVFQGQIRVAPDAQKTDAKMACNTLLLSDDADFSAKPELEIFADDVQCGHGATVIDINPTHLYYLRARGIPENKARAMLVNAFVDEIVEELEDEGLIETLETIISVWLEKHA